MRPSENTTPKPIAKTKQARAARGLRSRKAKNKAALQKLFELPVKAGIPLFGIVSRLVAHKGFDLVKAMLPELLATNEVQFVVLGTGDPEFERFFKQSSKYTM